MTRGMLATLLVLSAACRVASAQAWDARFVNPQAAEDDVILPLPCEGEIVLREVATPPTVPGALGDRSALMGLTAEISPHVEDVRRTYLLGGLRHEVPDSWYYLIGKYEVTADQYRSVMAAECNEPSMRGAFPINAISWFDAVEFTRRLSAFWHRNPPENLPVEGRYLAYARLPTEAEWEFAARGGVKVSEADFRAKLFPMEGGISDYTWNNSASSANGTPRPIGLRKPNPLGLYDILGLSEELVLEPFRANHVGRPHGQAGGVVTRGGSVFDDPQDLSTAMRSEYSLFAKDGGEALALGSFGLRIVVSAPVIASAERDDQLRNAWVAAAAAPVGSADDVVALLRALELESSDRKLIAALSNARELITSERRARQESEAVALRELLRSGAILSYRIGYDRKMHQTIERGIGVLRDQWQRAQDSGDGERSNQYRGRIEKSENALQGAQNRLALSRRGILDVIYTITDLYDGQAVAAARDGLGRGLSDSGMGLLNTDLMIFAEAVLAYEANPGLGADSLIDLVIQAPR